MTNNKTPNEIDLKIYSIDTAKDMLKEYIGEGWGKEESKEFFALANKIYSFLVS